jgi:tRNA dimethylallyltransferase
MRAEFFLVGPTAVGKSSLAVEVAKKIDAEIVNADAFQLYHGLDILSAKPDADARRRVRHHLLSAVELNETMSAAKFRALAQAALGGIRSREKMAIVVSGSGLYVKALTHGFDRTAPPNVELRTQLNALSDSELGRRLAQLKPGVAVRTDLKNRRRVMRAIEIAEGATTLGEKKQAVRMDARGIFLVRDRDDLYSRINERVQTMFCAGIEREVAALKNAGPTAEQALGLREIRRLLAGKISREDCIAKIQQKTRRYAKRQLTWFRHQTNFPQLNLTALSHREAISAITQAVARE